MIDVVIPTCNRPELTLDAVASVRGQTYPDWRLFVVDDASDDDTADRVEATARTDRRIVVVRRRQRGGSSAARQTGLEHASAPLVATLDSDDLWEPRKLEHQVALWNRSAARGSELGVVVCRHQYVEVNGDGGLGRLSPGRWSRRWTPFSAFNTSTPLLSRALLDGVGGFAPADRSDLRTTDHLDLFLRLTREHAAVVIPEVLVRCRRHPGRRNSDGQGTRAAAEEAACVLRLHAGTMACDRRRLAWLRAWVGGRYLQAGCIRDGMAHLRAALQEADALTRSRICIHYGAFVVYSLRTSRRARDETDWCDEPRQVR